MIRATYVVALLIVATSACCWAQALTPGNIIVSSSPIARTPMFLEFTPSGVLVQQFSLAAAGGDDLPRDLVLDNNGNVQFYGGTFAPEIVTLDPITRTITSTPSPVSGWSTVNNLGHGGIAAFGDFIFATDADTNGGPEAGFVRFDINTLTGTRVDLLDTRDLNVGLDGLLYVVPTNPRSGLFSIDVYNPTTLQFVREVTLDASINAVAVDVMGNIFATGGANGITGIHHFAPDGTLVNSLDTGQSIGGRTHGHRHQR